MIPGVTVLGSCRVHTPLQFVAADERVALRNAGVYGFTHSAKEALQQLAVMRGEQQIPLHLAPFITHKYLPANPELSEYVALPRNDLSDTDVLVVEVSSLKEIRFRDYYLQINRLAEKVIQNDPHLLEWWQMVYHGDAGFDRSPYVQAFHREPQRSIVQEASVTVQGFESLKTDMEAIVALHDGVTVFVSHFDMKTFQGKTIGLRERLALYMTDIVQDLDCLYINPRGLIEAFGPRLALKDMGHYKEPFERAIGEQLFAHFMAAWGERLRARSRYARTAASPPCATDSTPPAC